MAHAIRFRRDSQTEFAKAFRPLAERHQAWQVWADFVTLAAIELAVPLDPPDSPKRKAREKEYAETMRRYTENERKVFPTLFLIMVDALEAEPMQDFLGEMFMLLELSNHWKGQFFTPYDVCRMMAEMTMTDVSRHIEEKGWVGICDPACGAGALLVAARNTLVFRKDPIGKLSFHQQVLFVAQDIDRTAALMCYLQLSLLGCAGYVTVGNTLTNPGVGLGGNPVLPIELEGQDIWATPLFHDQVWVHRQMIVRMEYLLGSIKPLPVSDTPPPDPVPQSAAEPAAEAFQPAAEPEPLSLNATATGQLTFF